MTTKQTFREFGNKDRTCAIGAAQVAFGETPGSGSGLISLLSVPVAIGNCPDCHYAPDSFGQIIMHLNDKHHWPRQKIADHIEEYGL